MRACVRRMDAIERGVRVCGQIWDCVAVTRRRPRALGVTACSMNVYTAGTLGRGAGQHLSIKKPPESTAGSRVREVLWL